MRMKEKIFNAMGELYLVSSDIQTLKRNLQNAYNMADKIAHKLDTLENQYIQKYRKCPRFWRKL